MINDVIKEPNKITITNKYTAADLIELGFKPIKDDNNKYVQIDGKYYYVFENTKEIRKAMADLIDQSFKKKI